MTATGERGIDALPSGKFRVRVEDNGRALKVPLCATLEDAIGVRDGLYVAIAAGQFARIDGLTAAQWGPVVAPKISIREPELQGRPATFRNAHCNSAARSETDGDRRADRRRELAR